MLSVFFTSTGFPASTLYVPIPPDRNCEKLHVGTAGMEENIGAVGNLEMV